MHLRDWELEQEKNGDQGTGIRRKDTGCMIQVLKWGKCIEGRY